MSQQQQVVEQPAGDGQEQGPIVVPAIMESLTASALAAGIPLPPDFVTFTVIRAIDGYERQQRESRQQRWNNFITAKQSLWEGTTKGLAHIHERQQHCCQQFQDDLVHAILQFRQVEQQQQQRIVAAASAAKSKLRLRYFTSIILLIQKCQNLHDESKQHEARLIAACQENEATMRSRLLDLDRRDAENNRELVDVMMGLLSSIADDNSAA